MNEDDFEKSLDKLIRLARMQGALAMTLSFVLGIAFSQLMGWIRFIWK